MRPQNIAFISIAVVVTGVTSFLAFSPSRSGTWAFWALAVGPTVALAAVASTWAAREDLLRDWLRPRWGDFTRGLGASALLFALAWAVTRLVCPIGSSREIWLVSLYGQVGDPRSLQAHAGVIGAVLLVAAVAEEVLWRGAVTQLLAERVGSRAAWGWAAGLYGLSYVPTMWALRSGSRVDPVLVVAALGAGVLWGGMTRHFGRLTPSILSHALFDWAVIMMFPLWGPP